MFRRHYRNHSMVPCAACYHHSAQQLFRLCSRKYLLRQSFYTHWWKLQNSMVFWRRRFGSKCHQPSPRVRWTGRVEITSPIGCYIYDDFFKLITVEPPPVADFSCDPDSALSNFNNTVHFIDNSTGAVHWNWEIGPDLTTTEQNPTHSFLDTGKVIIRLLVTRSHLVYAQCVHTQRRRDKRRLLWERFSQRSYKF